MYNWHTDEPDKLCNEGWLGRAIRDIDPKKENVLTGVNFGRGLPRALAAPGVPVASVGNLETYGVLTGIEPTTSVPWLWRRSRVPMSLCWVKVLCCHTSPRPARMP